MSVEHRNLTGSALHEPKGAETAASGQIYVADGSGSGTWTDVVGTIKNSNLMALNVAIPDISTAGSVFVVSPLSGVITDIHVVLHDAITTADSTVTAKILTVPVTGISILVEYTGSAAGTAFSGTATALNSITAGDPIEIITDGLSTGVATATVTILVNVA